MNTVASVVPGRRFRLLFDLAVGVVLLIAAGLVILKNLPPSPNLPREPISLIEAAVEGMPTARVAVVEFSDYQCPFCGEFERQIKPALRATYIETGRVLWAFRNLPVESKHPQAFKAAMLAECARRQGQFLQVATALFERQRSLGDDLFVQLSHEFGLNEARLKECVSGEAEARVRADVALGRDLGITGTPTFLVGLLRSDGRVGVTAVLKGGLALPGFRQVLDDALKPKWYSGWAGLALAAGLVLISAAAMVGVSRKRR